MAEIKAAEPPRAPERPAPLSVTASAARRIRRIIEAEGKAGLVLRVSVSGGGCSGFQYKFDLDDQTAPDDIRIDKDGISVVVDGMSLMYVLGAELDFVEDLTGSYFRMSNPNATASCGCGTSFAI
jgi:iron-sulfur cluster insertion protein